MQLYYILRTTNLVASSKTLTCILWNKMNRLATKIKFISFCSLLLLNSLSLSLSHAANQSSASFYIAHSGVTEEQNEYFGQLVSALQRSKPFSHTIKQLNTKELTVAELEEMISTKNSCVISIGESALEKLLATRQNTSIYSTLVSKIKLDNLVHNYKKFGVPLSGIYEEQSLSRQIFLSNLINGQLSKVGVLLGNNSRFALPEIKELANRHSVELSYFILKYHASAQKYFEKLPIDGGSLLILNDSEHYSSADLRAMLLVSHERKIPLIGSKFSDTQEAALASVYTPQNKLALEVVSEAVKLCETGEIDMPRYSHHFEVSINSAVAKYFNLTNLSEPELAFNVRLLESNLNND